MKRLITWLSRRRFPYEPLIRVEISKSSILNNISRFRDLSGELLIAPVLKSNAYGHGLVEVAEILEDVRLPYIPFIIVDSYFEAVTLRVHGIKIPILIIGYTRPETIFSSNKLKKVSFTITSLEALKSISATSRNISIHLKVDVGMHRQGISFDQIVTAAQILKNNPLINLEGVCAHLSDASYPNSKHTGEQVQVWNKVVSYFKKEFPSTKYFHLSATDGILSHKDSGANLQRLGIGLYGISNNDEVRNKTSLLPSLEMKTIITSVKTLNAGESIGYGNTFEAKNDMKVATIPVGYYEGIDRRLSNKGFVLVGPDRVPCKILGRVSMNITSIDVTGLDCAIGSEVIVISGQPSDMNSVENIAKLIDSIPYEVLVKIPGQLKRVVG